MVLVLSAVALWLWLDGLGFIRMYVCLFFTPSPHDINRMRTYTSIHIQQVEAGPMVHTVPCVGFVVSEKDRPGMCG